MAIAPQRVGIGIRRHFTTADTHPYDEIVWERRDARITNYRDGSVAFEQLGVEVPESWSVNATNILAQKYFRGTPGTPEREWSLRQVADRVVDTVTSWGIKDGYFVDDEEAEAFRAELKHLIVHQKAAFNSPVWFNIGVAGVPQQGSACFILAVEDTMDSILNWYREEGVIFKGGSGAGVNLSKIRSSYEMLNGGGTASGPVSFMRGADASAGTIKSGGKTRRAAKMVILNVDHPDVEEFVWCKAKEEKKARVLRDAGVMLEEVALPQVPASEVAGLLISVEALAAFEPFLDDGRVRQLHDRMAAHQREVADPITGADVIKAIRVRESIQRTMRDFLDRYDVIVSPNFMSVAPLVAQDLNEALPYPDPLGGLAAACGLPGLALPIGPATHGLPASLQIVGAPYDEATLLDLGDLYQSRTPHHRAHPAIA